MWYRYGERSRFAFDIGPPDKEEPTTGTRRVDVFAADRWLTCDDNTVYVPQFVSSLEASIGWLLADPAIYNRARPYPELSVEENFRRLLADTAAGENDKYLSYRMMNWGPTSDNLDNYLFREGDTAHFAFSFWRERHHDSSELGRVFVTELPLRELLLTLHHAAWDLAWGRS